MMRRISRGPKPSPAMSLQQDRKLGALAVRIGGEVNGAEYFARRSRFGQHQRHLPIVVDLRQARGERVRQLLLRREEAHSDVLLRQLLEQRLERRLVLRAHWAQQVGAAV